MRGKRKPWGRDFMARVALAAVRGEETMAQPVARYQIHPTRIHGWKRAHTERAWKARWGLYSFEKNSQRARVIEELDGNERQ